jgi:hypothetical protein
MSVAKEHLTLAEHYSMLAARFLAKANSEKSAPRKNKWEQLADCYRRLAEDCRREPRLVLITP